MYSTTDWSLPFGENNRDIHEYGGTGMVWHTPISSIPIEMQIAWIQDPVKKQYRQMCNDTENFYIPNTI